MNKWLKIILILMAVGVIAAFAVYKFLYNMPHTDYAKAEPDYQIEAAALFEAYTQNREKAEKKYNGKVLQITGTPNKVEETDSLTIVVFTFSQGMFGNEGIRCTLLPQYEKTAGNISGKSTTIKGYCTGYNETDVILEQSSVLKN